MAPADHGVDRILHRELQPEGGLAGPGGVVLTGKRGGCRWAGAPEEEAGREGAQAQAWPCSPAHIGREEQPVSQLGLGVDIKGDHEGDLRKRKDQGEVTGRGGVRRGGGRRAGVGRSQADLGALPEDEVVEATASASGALALGGGAVTVHEQGAWLPLVLGTHR